MRTLCLFVVFSTFVHANDIDKEFATFAKAINHVEAMGKRNQVKPGDGGKAIGPLQIHWSYWRDATQSNPAIGGSYTDCNEWEYSVRVMKSYLKRHAPDAFAKKDWRTLSRIHNGGPTGHRETATRNYWPRVKKAMKQCN